MTQFVVNQPVSTDTAVVTVDAGLAVGSHRFRLEVVDSAGNVSKADEAVVQVERVIVAQPTTTTTTTRPVLTPTPTP